MVAARTGAVCLLFAGAALAGCGPAAAGTGSSKESVLDDYMAAVQAGDSGRLRAMSSPEFASVEVTDAIERELRKTGRRTWIQPRVEWSDVTTPRTVAATVSATDETGGDVTDVVHLVAIDGGWQVVLGPDS